MMKLRNFVAMGVSLAVLVGTLAGVTNAAFAQGAGKQGIAAGKRESPMAVGLKAAVLTETQKDQIQVISKKYRDERRSIVKELNPDAGMSAQGERTKQSPDMKAKIADIETKEITEVKAVLTPDQQAKFQTAYDGAKASRGNNGPLDQMMEKLALTDEQKEKLSPILTETTDAMAKVRQDTTLDRRAKMTKMADLWTATKEKIRPMLTADQQKTLDEMKALRGAGKRKARGAGAK
ncbi:MAG: hypothetical protein H7145_20330 [Akkermansiaceae bacterium]|nr:hypothetical protein [Armatimonadota bacterium]